MTLNFHPPTATPIFNRDFSIPYSTVQYFWLSGSTIPSFNLSYTHISENRTQRSFNQSKRVFEFPNTISGLKHTHTHTHTYTQNTFIYNEGYQCLAHLPVPSFRNLFPVFIHFCLLRTHPQNVVISLFEILRTVPKLFSAFSFSSVLLASIHIFFDSLCHIFHISKPYSFYFHFSAYS